MTRVAIIEDDKPTSDQLAGWIRSARAGIEVDQWFNRDDAEAALARETYDVVVLDIELERERHAGVAIINAINKRYQGTPVLGGLRHARRDLPQHHESAGLRGTTSRRRRSARAISSTPSSTSCARRAAGRPTRAA
jgi:DNA-binding NtrC family response regulator